MLVPVCDQVSAADDQDETHEGRASGEARTMTLAKAIGFDHDARNADQDRHGAERAELVDGVEGRVHVLGQHRSANRQPDRADESDEEQFDALGGIRLRVRDRRVEHPELLALLALLEALGQLSFFVTLQQRLIQRAGAVVVAGQLP